MAKGLPRLVLILVLVEHTLRGFLILRCMVVSGRLNPCFSGTYSQSAMKSSHHEFLLSLNPCFSGTYSQRHSAHQRLIVLIVLILVLVEHTLRAMIILGILEIIFVLILVLVEHTLRASQKEKREFIVSQS